MKSLLTILRDPIVKDRMGSILCKGDIVRYVGHSGNIDNGIRYLVAEIFVNGVKLCTDDGKSVVDKCYPLTPYLMKSE